MKLISTDLHNFQLTDQAGTNCMWYSVWLDSWTLVNGKYDTNIVGSANYILLYPLRDMFYGNYRVITKAHTQNEINILQL